jgi:hypothetical protein
VVACTRARLVHHALQRNAELLPLVVDCASGLELETLRIEDSQFEFATLKPCFELVGPLRPMMHRLCGTNGKLGATCLHFLFASSERGCVTRF